MWPLHFNQRLDSWVTLRNQVAELPIEDALSEINRWWFQSPWTPYHLHWDDLSEWPDPWQLLSDNLFCGVARGLGIMYTIAILNRKDMADACLVQTRNDNLVQVSKEKYILNYESDEIVNKSSNVVITNKLTLGQLQHRFK